MEVIRGVPLKGTVGTRSLLLVLHTQTHNELPAVFYTNIPSCLRAKPTVTHRMTSSKLDQKTFLFLS